MGDERQMALNSMAPVTHVYGQGEATAFVAGGGPLQTTTCRSPTTAGGWTVPRRSSSSSKNCGGSRKPPSVRLDLVGDHPPLDIDRVVEVLERHRVQYLLVGGVAARFHGSERLTEDVDVLPDDDDENLRRLAAALTELGRSSVLAA